MKRLNVAGNSAYQSLLLALITLLAGALRFYKLGEWSFWVDEVASINHSLAMRSYDSVVSSYHPLFYLLLRPTIALLGIEEWTTRLIAAFIGVISIPILYLLTRRVFGFRVAILAAALLAISPWHLYWSQNARFYTLLSLLFNIALFSFYWGIETDRFRYIIGAVLAWILALATHETAVLLAVIVTLYCLVLKVLPFEKPAGLRLRNVAPFSLLPLSGYLLFDAVRVVYKGSPSVLSNFVTVFIGRSNNQPLTHLDMYAYLVGVPLAFLAFCSTIYLLTKRERAVLLLATTAAVPVLTVMAFAPFAYTATRYVFVSLPSCAILASVTVRELYCRARHNKSVTLWAVGLLLLFFLKDPVLDDLSYYLGARLRVGFAIAGVALVPVFITLWGPRRLLRRPVMALLPGGATREVRPAGSYPRAGTGTAMYMWGLGILLPVLIHPVAMDSLYYTHQHGYRDDWRSAAAIVRERKSESDIVVSTLPPLADYYVGEKTQHVARVDLASEFQAGRRIWLVEEWGVQKFYRPLTSWIEAHCETVAIFDNYAAGRNFQMRVHVCDPAKGRSESIQP